MGSLILIEAGRQGLTEELHQLANMRFRLLESDDRGVTLQKYIRIIFGSRGLREKVMIEIHQSRYSIHPGSTKMHHDVKEQYWWDNMKKSISQFVAQCPNCQQVKIEHQKPGGLLQNIEILTWKWEVAYELELSSELEFVHPVFHVSMLRKSIGDPSRVVHIKDVKVIEDLSYEEVPMAILDRQVRKLRTKDVASVKALWRNKNMEEMAWEAEEEM
ncbi:uncharacterized protein [Nicotiana sylvestris]|uniref:uncharacterized protein n=1 Tax=Nicotiana sylvestris TaxID=4096 RepID=UPI00388C7076